MGRGRVRNLRHRSSKISAEEYKDRDPDGEVQRCSPREPPQPGGPQPGGRAGAVSAAAAPSVPAVGPQHLAQSAGGRCRNSRRCHKSKDARSASKTGARTTTSGASLRQRVVSLPRTRRSNPGPWRHSDAAGAACGLGIETGGGESSRWTRSGPGGQDPGGHADLPLAGDDEGSIRLGPASTGLRRRGTGGGFGVLECKECPTCQDAKIPGPHSTSCGGSRCCLSRVSTSIRRSRAREMAVSSRLRLAASACWERRL